MTPFRFALREVLHRRAYALLFVFSVGFGAAVLTAIGSFGAAAEKAVVQQARELWAADITVQGSDPLLDQIEPWAKKEWPGLRAARSVETISMVRFLEKEKAGQATLSAVSRNYPLYGAVQTSSGRPLPEVLVPGSVVVGSKLLYELEAEVGDALRIGTLNLRVADTIAARSDAPTSFFEFAPSVLITFQDLSASGLVVPGSRTRNTLYLNLPPGVDVARALEKVKDRASGESTEVSSWTSDNPGLLRFIKNTLTFLNFLGLMTLTLGGVGVASALSAAIAAAARSMGMVFALGAPRGYAVRVWLWWVLALTGVGILLAVILGNALAGLLIKLFGDLLPPALSLGFPLGALARAAAMGFSVSLLFTALPLLKLMDIPPNAILSNDVPIVPVKWKRTAAVLLFSAAAFYGLALAQIRQPLLALNYVGGLAAVLGVSWLLVAGVMRTLRSVLVRRAGLLPRLAGRGLSRPGNLNDAAVVSVSVALLVILALFLLEKNITAQWVESFPPSAPNVFFINIQKGQVEKFRGIVGRPEARLFPLIRGRVVAVNEVPVQRIQGRARQEQGDRLTREFGFTFGEDLLPTDQVISGGGLWDQRISGPQVSAFEGHQKRFGLKVGDRLTVNVLGRRITATVSSVRSIDQSVRQPFFYFYFRPGAIDAAPHTFMGGLHVPSRQIPELENRLARELPNVTVIDLSEVAALTGRILKRLTRIVNGLGLFGVASGLLLLVSSLWTTLVSRVRESVMYRTFGGSPGQVAGVYLLEYALMGVAGTLAAFLGGTAATWVLLRFVFDMSFNPFLLFTGAFLLLALAVMIAVSWLASRSAFRSAPMEVLRYE